MTQTLRTPTLVLVALVLGLCATVAAYAGARKGRPAVAKASSGQDKKSRADKGRSKSSAKEKSSARETRAQRRGRDADRSRDRSAKREERASKRDKRSRDDDRRGGRLSRRERLAEARREAERRRREEIARREAARRAELARLAALARDQALRSESAANIARDETTGEDMEVRRVAIQALGNLAGTVVVMDPKTGRVYTIVNQDWALRRGWTPCSTIKLVTGLAGLSESVIDPVQTVNISTGSYRLDLTDSLAFSNNVYFQRVGGSVGFDRMMSYARQLGLGEVTGINHVNESPGRVPLYKTGYAVNHMSSHGDDFEVTPIQLATLASAFANGGNLLVPHLPRTPQENVKFKTEVRRRLNIPQETLRRIIPGMIGAVNYGTAKLAYDPLQTIAGKTGTCTGQGAKLGLFTSYGPVNDPKLAIAVVTRGLGQSGRVAAGVAGRIYRALNHRFGNGSGTPQFATTPEIFAPRPKIDPATAAAISDEDKEADDTITSEASQSVTGAGSTGAQNLSVKSVLKPVQTRPTDVTTRPAATPSSPSATPKQPDDSRPRRVLATSP